MNSSVAKANPVPAIVEDMLETLNAVERDAIECLRGDAYLTPDSIGIANPVRAEKAIARVVGVDNSGEERTCYVYRTSPPSGFRVPLISYRSLVGAMASREVGDRFTLSDGNVVVLRQPDRPPTIFLGASL